MTLYDFGCLCWIIAFICFSYIWIELQGETEEFELWCHRIRMRNANRMNIALYKLNVEDNRI